MNAPPQLAGEHPHSRIFPFQIKSILHKIKIYHRYILPYACAPGMEKGMVVHETALYQNPCHYGPRTESSDMTLETEPWGAYNMRTNTPRLPVRLRSVLLYCTHAHTRAKRHVLCTKKKYSETATTSPTTVASRRTQEKFQTMSATIKLFWMHDEIQRGYAMRIPPHSLSPISNNSIVLAKKFLLSLFG